MLEIEVPISPEIWDEKNEEFIPPKVQKLQLEHSLVSLSKWESKWCKPFLTKKDLTTEETIDYIKFMTITRYVDPEVYNHLTQQNVDEIRNYIQAPMTATTFPEDRSTRSSREIVTSELIYYWMIALNIPVEFEKWHLNRLLTLVRVCNIKNAPPKKRSRSDIASRNASLNAQRRAKLNTKG